MQGYLGEVTVTPADVPEFANHDPTKWALDVAAAYGGIDGDHHKSWVIDQMVRILLGTPVVLSLARWEDGDQEYRFKLGQPSAAYQEWVAEQRCGGQYEWNEGIAP